MPVQQSLRLGQKIINFKGKTRYYGIRNIIRRSKNADFGLWSLSGAQEECERCVLDALKAGYRSIDTAQSYFNEEEVGSFCNTKVRNPARGY